MSIKKVILNILEKLGISDNDIYLLKSVKHSGWIARVFTPGNNSIPTQRFTLSNIEKPNTEDIQLCERLIKAFQFSLSKDSSGVSPMWKDNLDKKQSVLFDTLTLEDPESLAILLSKMFQSKILYGIDSGDLYTGRNWRIHSLKLLDDLVSLAEYLGVVRAESGQGTIAHAFSMKLDDLIEAIEGELGCSIGCPSIGGAYGIFTGKTLLTLQSPEYVYVAARVSHLLENYFPLSLSNNHEPKLKIVEIGAGYGGTANFFHRLYGDRVSTYSIIDLPIVNVLQGYYLGKSLGVKNVILSGETKPVNSSGVIEILPTHSISEKTDIDVLINQNSMPEIPLEAAAAYLQWALKEAKVFISYNYEALTENRDCAVVTVPEVVSHVGGFHRDSRMPSWVRPGYVEEVYLTKQYNKS